MARPKRMGAYNALDDLLPGGDWGTPTRSSRRRPPGRPRARNALDDLLPGPAAPPRQGPGAAPRRRVGRHLAAWNPLDDLRPASPTTGRGPVPARARVSFRLPADLVEAARDAVAHLAGTAEPATLTALTERALRAELARLAAVHNHGRPFPPRAP
jgi:hypothetical protein